MCSHVLARVFTCEHMWLVDNAHYHMCSDVFEMWLYVFICKHMWSYVITCGFCVVKHVKACGCKCAHVFYVCSHMFAHVVVCVNILTHVNTCKTPVFTCEHTQTHALTCVTTFKTHVLTCEHMCSHENTCVYM